MKKIELNELTRTDRKSWSWTDMQEARCKDVLEIFEAMHSPVSYWPLTERAAYYQIISSNLSKGSHWFKHGNPEKGRGDLYSAIGRLLKWMRIDDRLPWEALTDEQRVLTDNPGYENPEQFLHTHLHYFLKDYRRCLAKRQPYYIEVWLEKATLLHIVKPITDKYCRMLMCCKGYNSITFQADFYNRASEALSYGQKPVVLYFGDWDPSGVNMLYAAAQTLVDELGLVGTQFYRCGINQEHFDLIHSDPVPVKGTDSRAKKFIQRYGSTAYELDAFHPAHLQQLVEEAVMEFTDMDAVMDDLEMEKDDHLQIENIKNKVRDMIIYDLQ